MRHDAPDHAGPQEPFGAALAGLDRLTGPRAAPHDPEVRLLSACMIVKDEQEHLSACLESLRGLVDEVVVYDTGSTDGTVALARSLGAVVVEGYWDDDFARARNASLDRCSGTWVLHVDADEVVTGGAPAAEALRSLLRSTRDDVLRVQIANLGQDGVVGVTHTGARLFRRTAARWRGHLHEQVVSRSERRLSWGTSEVVLEHVGYRPDIMAARGKLDRNVQVARQGLRASDGRDLKAVLDLGRALLAAEELEQALEHFVDLRRRTDNRDLLRQAFRNGAEVLMSLGRSGEALGWVEGLRATSTSTSMPRYLEGRCRLNLLHLDQALACLDGLAEVRDEDVTVAAHDVRLTQGLALAAAARWDEAAQALVGAARGRNVPLSVWAPLVESQWRSGRPMEEVADWLPEQQTLDALGQALNVSVEAVDALAEALWTTGRSRSGVIACVLAFAPRLSLARALEWAGRLRRLGLVEQCTVHALAVAPDALAVERLRACAVLHAGFADDRGTAALQAAADAVPEDAFASALLAVDGLAPPLLAPLVLALASTTERRRTVAHVLAELGAGEQAEALLATA